MGRKKRISDPSYLPTQSFSSFQSIGLNFNLIHQSVDQFNYSILNFYLIPSIYSINESILSNLGSINPFNFRLALVLPRLYLYWHFSATPSTYFLYLPDDGLCFARRNICRICRACARSLPTLAWPAARASSRMSAYDTFVCLSRYGYLRARVALARRAYAVISVARCCQPVPARVLCAQYRAALLAATLLHCPTLLFAQLLPQTFLRALLSPCCQRPVHMPALLLRILYSYRRTSSLLCACHHSCGGGDARVWLARAA